MVSSSYPRKYLIVFILLLALGQVSFGNAIILDQNLLGNGGFENGENGWIGISSSDVVSTVSFTGDNSLYFSSNNSRREVLSTRSRIQYTSNTRYAVTASYKNTSATGNVKLGVRLSGDDNYPEMELVLPLNLSDISSWTDVRFIIELPFSTPPAKNIQLCIIIEDDYSGEIWFDELSLQGVLPGKNQMVNGGFEEGDTGWSIRSSKVDGKYTLSGDWAIKMIEDPNNANNLLTNDKSAQIPINEKDSYLLTCYYLMDTEGNSTTSFRPQVRHIRGSDTSVVYDRYYCEPENFGNWVKFQKSIPFKETSERISMYFQVNKSFVGNVWIDDFEFLTIPATLPELVSGFNVNRNSLETIECSWDGASDEPFKYNLYVSTEAGFTPDENTLYATIDGAVTSFEYRIPKSRRANRFYFAIAAVDIGGQEGEFAYAEAIGAARVKFEVGGTGGEFIENAKVVVENVEDYYTDSTGNVEFMLLEGTYNCVVRKQGYTRENYDMVINDILPVLVEISMNADNTPPEPVTVEVDDSTPGLVILTWTVPAPASEDGDLPGYYVVYKSTNNEELKTDNNGHIPSDFKVDEIQGESISGEQLEWLDNEVDGETTYYYVVAAFDLADNPAYSNIVSAAVKMAPTPNIISPKAKKPFLNEVIFEWAAMKGAETYFLEVSEDDQFVEGNTVAYSVSKTETSYTVSDNFTPGVWYWRMKVLLDTGAESNYTDVETFVIMDVTDDSLPIAYFVTSGLYNPLKGDLEISYVLKEPGEVSINIYTLEGRLVKSILNAEQRDSGAHHNYWDGKWYGRTVLNGLYFIKLDYDNGSQKTSSFNKLFVWKE